MDKLTQKDFCGLLIGLQQSVKIDGKELSIIDRNEALTFKYGEETFILNPKDVPDTKNWMEETCEMVKKAFGI